MTMLSEEIDRLIKHIEGELLEFVKYVKTIEGEYNKLLSPNGQTSGVSDQREESRNHSEDDKDLTNNGIYDAIEITKVMVKSIYNLLYNFSNAITVKERASSDSDSYLENYFYNQYVSQIVAYLLKILEENLSIFSGELIQSGENRSHATYSVREKEAEKRPLTLRFAFFKPATLFTEDGKMFQSVVNPKPDTESHSTHSDSDRTELNGTSSQEDRKCDHYRCHECFEKEKKKSLVLSNILKSLDTLVSVVEKLLLQFRNFSESSKQSSPLYRGVNDITPGYEAKTGKETDYVLKECIKFCDSCKTLLKNPKYKNVQLYKEYNKENPNWYKTHKPQICATLYRMEEKEQHTSPCKYADEKESHCQGKENAYPHNKHIPDNYFDAGNESLKEQDPIPEATSSEHTKDGTIPASPKNNKNLTPHQEREKQSTVKRNDIPLGKVKSCVCNLAKILQSGSKEVPKALQKRKRHVSPPASLLGGQLFTSSKDTGTSQVKIDSSSSSENDDDYVDEASTAYPRTVVFDVKKFSHLLKEKFKKTEGRSKSKELLDIVITSLKESSDFKYEEVGKKVDRIFHLEAKTDTAEDVEVKADKAVDGLVDDVIRIAAKFALSDSYALKKFYPQEEGIRAEEDEQNVDLPAVDSEEIAKNLYPEQFELKFHNVTHACISCLNMKESITTELPRERKHSTVRVHGKRSLTDVCFQCLNACQRGLIIHQCHFTLPSDMLEIRHMDDTARILVCFLKWDFSKEPDDWRWQRNPFPDPTHVEIQQPATSEQDPILKVVYGLEGAMVKESFGETSLRTIRDFPKILHDGRTHETVYGKVVTSDSMSTFKGEKIMKKIGLRYKKTNMRDISRNEFHLSNKLSRFYHDIQRFGYGRGPPLILKLRKNYQLNDAYDLLMAPSKVRLHYYRNIRVLLVSEDNTRKIISKSNFVEEDKSNELFETLARKLFSTEGYHLFDYPSEEAQYMYLNPDTHTHPQWFVFAGTVLALAFLHQKKMGIKISSCLFKCLLDRPLVIGDLQSIDPLLYQKLMWLKKNNLSNRKARLTFIIRDQVGIKTTDTELIVNGKNVAVTEKNKYRYIELAVKWKLAERCLTQLKDFRRGFVSVIDPCLLAIFKEDELLSIIKNPPDFEMLMPECLSEKKGLTRRGTW